MKNAHSRVGEDGAVVPHVVVRVDDGIRSLAGNVGNALGKVIALDKWIQRDRKDSMLLATYALEASQVGRVEWTGEASGRRAETLHREGNTESVEALVDEELLC